MPVYKRKQKGLGQRPTDLAGICLGMSSRSNGILSWEGSRPDLDYRFQTLSVLRNQSFVGTMQNPVGFKTRGQRGDYHCAALWCFILFVEAACPGL